MSIQTMNCPHCGREATEYQECKWQCLYCGTKFIYEPPPKPPPLFKPDRYIKNEKILSLDETSHFFLCSSCGGRFSRLSFPEFKCRVCGQSLCKDHAIHDMHGSPPICRSCQNLEIAERARLAAEQRKRAKLEQRQRDKKASILGAIIISIAMLITGGLCMKSCCRSIWESTYPYAPRQTAEWTEEHFFVLLLVWGIAGGLIGAFMGWALCDNDKFKLVEDIVRSSFKPGNKHNPSKEM